MNTNIIRRLKCIISGIAAGAVMILPFEAMAASSWAPTLLVNTESFQTIDEGDSTTNIELRYGGTLGEKLIYERALNQFRLTRGLLVSGNISGTGSLAMSGAIRADGDLTINDDRTAATDAILTFGNATANKAITFSHANQRFEFNDDIYTSAGLEVDGTTQLDGALNVAGATKIRANLSGSSLNVDGNANLWGALNASGAIRTHSSISGASLTIGGASTVNTITANGAVTIAGLTKVRNTLSGTTLRVDSNASIHGALSVSGALRTDAGISGASLYVGGTTTIKGLAYEFPTSQSANTYLKTDGNGSLTWSSTAAANGSGDLLHFSPEYPNAVYFGSGSATTGQLTYGYDSTNKENYYRWTSTKSALNQYWTSVRVRVPDNFSSWDPIAPIQLRYRTGSGQTTGSYVSMRVLDTAGALRPLSGGENLANTSWTTATITGPESGGTWTAKGYMTILLKLAGNTTQSTAWNADLGYFNLNFETTTP